MVREYFDEVWDNIHSLQGQEFKTGTGETFRYSIEGNPLKVSLKGQKEEHLLDECTFFNTYLYMSQYLVSNTDDLNSVASYRGEGSIKGSSYIWAILNDERVLAASN